MKNYEQYAEEGAEKRLERLVKSALNTKLKPLRLWSRRGCRRNRRKGEAEAEKAAA